MTASGIVAAVVPFTLQFFYGQSFSPLVRLVLGCSLFLVGYLGMLLYVMGQKAFYMDVLRKVMDRTAPEEKVAVLA